MMLGLPEMPRLRARMRSDLAGNARRHVVDPVVVPVVGNIVGIIPQAVYAAVQFGG